MKNILLYIIIIGVFAACKKTMYKTGVSGKVVDQETGAAIDKTIVFLIGSNAGSTGTPSFTEIEKMTTTSDGEFSFSFNRSEYQHYYLYAKPFDESKYYSTGSYNDYVELSFNKKFRKEFIEKDLKLLHCGYLTVNFNHVSSDTILFVSVGYDKGALYTNYGGLFSGYAPSFMDNSTYTFCLQSNTNNNVNITTTKKGMFGAETIDTTINLFYYTISHQTSFFQLNY